MSGPVPMPTPDTLPYWEGAAQGELRIQYCNGCSEYYFYPRPRCPKCGSADTEWRAVSGNAKLVSFVINHRTMPPFEPKVPVIVALVELEEGPRMMSTVVDVEVAPESLELDMPLQVKFIERGDQHLPVFAPASK